MVYVDKDKCTGCGVCQDSCPVGAIQLVQDVA
ncbi:MAG: 4Fe-4S binding protein, partial [Candidatus Latescibacteria bacterium]|nr:4Fe-4S binding protein [Candidatus Latescibacterota bacterium]